MNPNQDPTRDAIAQAMMRESLIRQGLQPQAERLAGRDARGNDAPVPVGAYGTAGMGAQPWPLTSLGRPPEYAGVLGFQGGSGGPPAASAPSAASAPGGGFRGFGVGGSGMAGPVDTGVAGTANYVPGTEPVARANYDPATGGGGGTGGGAVGFSGGFTGGNLAGDQTAAPAGRAFGGDAFGDFNAGAPAPGTVPGSPGLTSSNVGLSTGYDAGPGVSAEQGGANDSGGGAGGGGSK